MVDVNVLFAEKAKMGKFKKNKVSVTAAVKTAAAVTSPGVEDKNKKFKKKDNSKAKFEQKMKKKKFKEKTDDGEDSGEEFTLGNKNENISEILLCSYLECFILNQCFESGFFCRSGSGF